MNNDRRTFLDGSTAPRKPLPAPLTEGAMKAAMEDWLTALPKPAVKEFFGVQKKFPNPKDKKTVDAKNLEILKKYKVKPLIGDPSHRESLSALSCCLDMLIGGQGEMPWESVKVNSDSIEEVMGEAKNLLVELQTPEREQMQMKELQKLQIIARAKAKAWDTRSTNPKSGAQEAVFDAAVDKLSDEVRDAENERRYEKVIDKGGKDMKKPSAALLKQLLPQRTAQLKRDASDYNDWVGTSQFDRDSSKASIIIDEIKKGLSRAKTTKKESVMTTEAKDAARAKHNAAVLRAAGGAKAYQAQKMAKRPIMDREISEFVARLSAKQIILLKKLVAARIADAAALLGVKGSGYQYQGGNQIGNDIGDGTRPY